MVSKFKWLVNDEVKKEKKEICYRCKIVCQTKFKAAIYNSGILFYLLCCENLHTVIIATRESISRHRDFFFTTPLSAVTFGHRRTTNSWSHNSSSPEIDCSLLARCVGRFVSIDKRARVRKLSVPCTCEEYRVSCHLKYNIFSL